MFFSSILFPTGPIALPYLVADWLLPTPALADSNASYVAPDALFSSLESSYVLLIPTTQPGFVWSWAWLQPSVEVLQWVPYLFIVGLIVLLLMTIDKLGNQNDRQRRKNRKLLDRAEKAELEIKELQANAQRVKSLLTEHDQLFQAWVFRLEPWVSTDQYNLWNKANWKKYTRNALATTALIRPVTYKDYRDQINSYSPTYGKPMPTLAAKAWPSPEPESDWFADSLTPTGSSLNIISPQSSMYDADDVSIFLTQLQESLEVTELVDGPLEPLPTTTALWYAKTGEGPSCYWPNENALAAFKATQLVINSDLATLFPGEVEPLDTDNQCGSEYLAKLLGLPTAGALAKE
jgi:hypothetical protein